MPHGSKTNVCPTYKFDVIQADVGMALVRKICPGFEYGAQAGKEPKYHWEVSYLLYDSQTSSLAVLCNNVQSTRGDPNPDPKPTQLKVKRVQNGYEVEWDAVNPVYRSYTAEKVDGKLQLLCRDLTAPKGEERGVNCELGQLSRVP